MSAAGAALAGVGEAALATVATVAYLATTEVDDGLEALVFLPVLAVLGAVFAAVAGWRRRDLRWPVVSALAAAAAAVAGLMVSAGTEGDGDLARSALGAGVVILMFAVVGSVLGWVLGAGVRRVVVSRR